MERFDIAIIGGGLVGLATAMALVRPRPRPREGGRMSVIVLEAEHKVAVHQSGHNSGVIHSGLYYKPLSLKARMCVAGREMMERFCDERGIARERCGKIVIATDERETAALDELERRGRANGLEGLRRLGSSGEIREIEPHAGGIAGLLVPQTGIVDYRAAAREMAKVIGERGGEVRTGCAVAGCVRGNRDVTIETTRGPIACSLIINCAGLHSDRIARMCSPAAVDRLAPGVRIVPFRGEYHELTAEASARGLVRNLIYPVPDARFPFLGVHFTRMIGGAENGRDGNRVRIEAGPNAVLALSRHGYGWSSFNVRDALEVMTYRGMWRLALKHWRTGLGEVHRSLSRGAFVQALRKLVPELLESDLVAGAPGRAGVRAQAMKKDGSLVDDFVVVGDERSIHVLNAPSPGATASLAIGGEIAGMAMERLGR